jgi:arylformamidase
MPAFVDLSHVITEGLVTYPGLPVPHMGVVLSREASRGKYAPGVEFIIGSVEMCTNTGTYLDTPFHRYEDGYDLTGLDLSFCADLPLVVADVVGGAVVTDVPDNIEGCAVVFRTGWSEHWGTPQYFDSSHGFVSGEACSLLVERKAALVGIDSLNIDSTAGPDRPAHSILLRAGIPIVEHLTNLADLPTRGARFSAVPPKITGLGTFTVRAFALVPDRPTVCEIVIDCADVGALSAFWATVTGGTAIVRSDNWATVIDSKPGGVVIAFQRVPESKTAKNRVHIDINSDDIPGDTARAVAAGATAVGAIVEDEVGDFQVLLDPEGNEFCIVAY